MATEMTKTAAQPSVLDLLLSGDIPNVEKELPTATYKIDRLSDLAGHDVVFKLKALPYGKVHDIERFTQDTEVHILLAGCVEPNLKDERLLEKFGGATPADAVKKMLLAGEITDLAQVIERLSGYRRLTITEVKNVRALWEGGTGWHDLILAMSSYEANQRRPQPVGKKQHTVRSTKRKKK